MKKLPSKNNQQGVVIVFTAISLLAMLGMAGLAIDLGHSYTIKTRLQNATDAAALSAATAIYKQVAAATPGSTVDVNPSIQKALGTFKSNVLGANFWGLQMNTSNISASFCVSSNLQDFSTCLNLSSIPAPTAGSPNINFFVRATAINTNNANSPAIDLRPFIIQVLGINQKSVGASAVAGLRSTSPGSGEPTCNLSPMFLCNGNSAPGVKSTDYDCADGSCFGNTVGKSYYLKASSKCPPTTGASTCPATPNTTTRPITLVTQLDPIANFDGIGANTNGGNFMMSAPQNQDGSYNTGSNALRQAMVNPSSCIGDRVQAAPGNNSDMIQALNAIFNSGNNGPLSGDQFFSNYQDLVTITSSSPYTINTSGSGTTTVEGNQDRYTFNATPQAFLPVPPPILTNYLGDYADANNVPAGDNASGPITPNIWDATDQAYRRVVGVPVVNCGASVPQNTQLPILGIACLFLPEPIQGNGSASYLIGELIYQTNCGIAETNTDPTDPLGTGIEIVLYDDYLNNDE